ncbi:hypothetical protein LTR84_009025 [Exophiala bonariae]|uniref:Hemerythrin-like domain-containing protein n=1 Tax=Exophiala bonariae TaxID=1690606 RepID=A0AAV9MVX6_9EURO|nr:hypothetical protein LTR84_009025 [Exophiala bonariae]
MLEVPIIREPVPRNSSPEAASGAKSPTQPRYSHLLYLSEAEREVYTANMQRSSSSSSRSVRSNRSARSSAQSQVSASTHNTSRISMQAPRWADDHYPLINTIHPENVPSTVSRHHSVFSCARQMAQIHNMIIRALNSSWNYAPTVKPSTQAAADFLLFNQQLFTSLDHHHKVEDDFMFPAVEKLLGRPGAMEENVKGHQSFAEGLAIFQKYIFVTRPDEFNGMTFRHIIESFAPELIQHLHDEISSLMSLHVLDSNELMKIWKHTEQMASKATDLYSDIPWRLGCQDKSFTIDGAKCTASSSRWILDAVVRNWHARRHAGAWRFCPSDLHGLRRQIVLT